MKCLEESIQKKPPRYRGQVIKEIKQHIRQQDFDKDLNWEKRDILTFDELCNKIIIPTLNVLTLRNILHLLEMLRTRNDDELRYKEGLKTIVCGLKEKMILNDYPVRRYAISLGLVLKNFGEIDCI